MYSGDIPLHRYVGKTTSWERKNFVAIFELLDFFFVFCFLFFCLKFWCFHSRFLILLLRVCVIWPWGLSADKVLDQVLAVLILKRIIHPLWRWSSVVWWEWVCRSGGDLMKWWTFHSSTFLFHHSVKDDKRDESQFVFQPCTVYVTSMKWPSYGREEGRPKKHKNMAAFTSFTS